MEFSVRLGCGLAFLSATIVSASAALAQGTLASNNLPHGSISIPMRAVGRIDRIEGIGSLPLYRSQWPGAYYEARIRGKAVILRFGPGNAHWIVDIDGKQRISLVSPERRLYSVDGLSDGLHRIKVQVASESPSEISSFGGFFTAKASSGLHAAARTRQIEFIGDSFTVGYGNTSQTRQCSDDEAWATTDASQGVGPRVAQALSAEYQVNAASGRGMVRNFNGLKIDTLPQMYPYTFFNKQERYQDSRWKPQVIVINLGTNDFSKPLKPEERWTSRDELTAEYETMFVAFIAELRRRNPRAYFLLWGTETPATGLTTEEAKVAERVRHAGEKRIAFLPVQGLSLKGCNSHPSVPDDALVADVLLRYFTAHPQIWGKADGRKSNDALAEH